MIRSSGGVRRYKFTANTVASIARRAYASSFSVAASTNGGGGVSSSPASSLHEEVANVLGKPAATPTTSTTPTAAAAASRQLPEPGSWRSLSRRVRQHENFGQSLGNALAAFLAVLLSAHSFNLARERREWKQRAEKLQAIQHQQQETLRQLLQPATHQTMVAVVLQAAQSEQPLSEQPQSASSKEEKAFLWWSALTNSAAEPSNNNNNNNNTTSAAVSSSEKVEEARQALQRHLFQEIGDAAFVEDLAARQGYEFEHAAVFQTPTETEKPSPPSLPTASDSTTNNEDNQTERRRVVFTM